MCPTLLHLCPSSFLGDVKHPNQSIWPFQIPNQTLYSMALSPNEWYCVRADTLAQQLFNRKHHVLCRLRRACLVRLKRRSCRHPPSVRGEYGIPCISSRADASSWSTCTRWCSDVASPSRYWILLACFRRFPEPSQDYYESHVSCPRAYLVYLSPSPHKHLLIHQYPTTSTFWSQGLPSAQHGDHWTLAY